MSDIDSQLEEQYGIKKVKKHLAWQYASQFTVVPTALILHEFAIKLLDINRQDLIPWYIVSATIFLLSEIADSWSTAKTMETIGIAEERDGKIHPVYETNPFLPARPIRKDLFSGKQAVIMGNKMVAGTILPPWNNRRSFQRYFAINNLLIAKA